MEERLLGSGSRETEDLKRRVWTESKRVWDIGFPATLGLVSQYGMLVVTQAFIGRAGEVDQLAAYALVQIITLRFTNGILLGMSTATETLCGQAFGAKQYQAMGIYLQRSWIINLVTATILLPLFIFGSQIFFLLGEDNDLAVAAGYISLWFIPALYFYAVTFAMQRFLQTQLRNMIVGWVSAAAFVVHVLLSWVFVNVMNWGIPGAMSALAIACWLVVVSELVYVFGGWCSDTWKGFSWVAFSDLGPILKLSISSGVMFCLELWYNAILVLLAGYMKNATTQISALSICLNVNVWEFYLAIGFLFASSVRVSNELGRGDAKAAKFAVEVLLGLSISMGVVFFIICLVFGRQIAVIFTSDEDVIESVSSLSLLLAISVLLNNFEVVLTGVYVGTGRQTLVAYINIGCYYLIGLPIGAVLGYVVDLQVKGVWIGMIIGVAMQVIVLGYITVRTNWDQQVKQAAERIDRWTLRPASHGGSEVLTER